MRPPGRTSAATSPAGTASRCRRRARRSASRASARRATSCRSRSALPSRSNAQLDREPGGGNPARFRFRACGNGTVVTVGQLISDRYELKHVVGTGGMSSVYCAHDTLLERDVALKILHEHFSEDDDYVERFRREARAAAQLSHPGIVTVIDRGEEDRRQFIVFEFVDGETLKDLVERGGPMPVRRAIELGLEIGRALAFAHQQGIVHRDVKPQNFHLNVDCLAQVTYFGISRTLDAVGHTETGTVLGTSHYIAPEQARGERVDAQTDVYSFGVLLYELLAGEVPYSGENFLTVAMKHVNEPVPGLLERRTDCPLRLAAVVERCMAKEPADRPASMDEVVAELQACLHELGG